MDARRVDVVLHLPQAFLTDAAMDYLADTDYDELTDDWAEAAYAELAKPVHGRQAAPAPSCSPTGKPPTRLVACHPEAGNSIGRAHVPLADYLEQHGRTNPKPTLPARPTISFTGQPILETQPR
ncbi:hypothetical protein [Streptomyces sp. ISL-86]|uniref:hypothetical protein n=1 Tax=Streptomyces sp. ISL-86 TaxID=2819187 RepID=UPI001BE8B396|nr:hypothetical protein [Streptomyces sp. ISL-86]MBT2459152.1 hypothetical protein [Streptomyces sp. ISL-86]